MRKVWVNVKENNYQTNPEWKIGEIVGEQEAKRYFEHATMAQTLEGKNYWIEKKFLVQLESGIVVEVWNSDAYDIILEGAKEAKKV